MGTRNPFAASQVTSRRGGPVKAPLSRDAIVKVALAQLLKNGLEGMSLRKVAMALQTGPASLYAYVEDLEELHVLVLDRALGSVNVRGTSTSWRERLMAVLASYFHVLSRSPGIAQLALSTVAAGPNALRVVETLLGLLEEAGIGAQSAAWGVDLLILYVTGIAAEQSRGLNSGHPEGAVGRAVRAVSARDYPRIHAAREQLLGGAGEERFAWAIAVLLAGMLGAPSSPSNRPAPAKSGAAKPVKARRAR